MRSSSPVEIAVADKNPVVLAGFKTLLARDARFRLVVTASDGERFLAACDRVAFQVGVIGWEMPFLAGREVLSALKTRPSAPRVVVYSGTRDADAPRAAMRLGAAAFISKQEPFARILEVLVAVAAGHMVFPFIDVGGLWDDPLALLTARERALLIELGSGKTNAELARSLGVSANTIKFHLRNLFDKLGVRSRAQAVQLWHELRA